MKIKYAEEILKIYSSLDEEQKKTLEGFTFQVVTTLYFTGTEKNQLAYWIGLLPEQEQEKIYYMLKGFEVFGKPLCAKNN